MTTLVTTCPHCRAENMTLRIVAQTTGAKARAGYAQNFVYLWCSNCGMPSTACVTDGTGSRLPPAKDFHLGMQSSGWRILDMWPEVPPPNAPAYIPPQVEKAYLAAEKNYPSDGMEEAAAGSYGRALDIATKLFAPDLAEKTLYNRIKGLAADGRITKDLGEWAHAIRLIRNDALHAIDEITRDELKAVRGFSETVLTYLYTLPGMLAARQADTTEKPEAKGQ